MIIESSFEQGTEEWLAARMGSVGGTGISKIITSTGKPSKSREKYLYEKASQFITGRAKKLFPSYEMQWGTDHEPEARELFSFIKKVKVLECAMIWADESKNNHVSPDGYFTEDVKSFGLEIKCPQLEAHDSYLESGSLPTAYKLQVQSSLALTGWDTWYFMSYFPGVKPLIIPVKRDEALIKTIKIEVRMFLNDLDKLIERLKS